MSKKINKLYFRRQPAEDTGDSQYLQLIFVLEGPFKRENLDDKGSWYYKVDHYVTIKKRLEYTEGAKFFGLDSDENSEQTEPVFPGPDSVWDGTILPIEETPKKYLHKFIARIFKAETINNG